MRARWGLVVLVLFTAVLHHGALRNEFYWDDRPLIVEGHLVRSWSSVPAIFTHEMWFNADLGERAPRAKIDTYRPLSNLSFLVDYQIYGPNPAGFHATNLLIHLACVVLASLVFSIFASPPFALLGAAIFALHPMTLEPIHYAAARTDSLAALFIFLATWLFFRKKPTRITAIMVSAAFLCGALVKETALFFPVFAVGTLAVQKRRMHVPNVAMIIASLGSALAVYFFLRLNALGGAKAIESDTHTVEMLLNYPSFVFRFFKTAFIPLWPMPMQTISIVRPPANATVWFSAFGFYTLSAFILFFCFRRSPTLGAIGAWVLLALAPPFAAVSMIEEFNPRYLYPALLGFAGSLAYILHRWSEKNLAVKLPLIVGWLSCCVLATLTFYRSADYRTEETFYRGILNDGPHSVTAEFNLGNTLFRHKRWEEAIPLYTEVVRRRPDHVSAINNLGMAHLSLNQPGSAAPYFERAVAFQPGNERYRFNLYLAERDRGHLEKAYAYLEEVLSISPDDEGARQELTRICGKNPPEILRKECQATR
ncbi:MAG TPA: tetratricopeptide repeat protein [Bdellovibrionota bacterium]|nr:tetratricopeptide repeat protein [Bdellovibrionota bacterium]